MGKERVESNSGELEERFRNPHLSLEMERKKLRFQKDESEVRRETTKSPRSANQWDKACFFFP